MFNQNEYFIFDLDGTLYEDTNHFSYYAEQLKNELDKQHWDAFEKEYDLIISGDHAVAIGRIYDVVRDQIVRVDSSSMKVIEAWTWQGEALDQDQISSDYPAPITCDFETMIAIGDGWWLPNACAKHFGVVDTYSAYEKTKEYMAGSDFQLTRIPRLRQALLHLKGKKQICLLTNSQEDDVQRLLNRLDLEGIFDEIITEARKPQYTSNHFSSLLKKHNYSPEQCVSIGDNFINEIAPALRLGIKTVFIDINELDYPEYDGIKVQSISDILDDFLSL
ncbi:HAD family hydrolase [Bacillus horti]|uniref:Hydrolase of the HAD superfamily n=1 Tax=Caldalkalibacillus horti TaxID=77523 RepID=A0ABT9W3X3_9BACI|nr:HAD family hydrolase [Bacillus horti]MDQ0167777.1 putative hydrolase of the HAD superfamily [Bacillus horti]